MSILDRHFELLEEIRENYRRRVEDPRFLEAAIRACGEQIAMAPKAANAFRKEYLGGLPLHTGYHQLAIIREKQDDFSEAIRLCEEAKKAGWGQGCTAGPYDWDARIARLRKKLGKKTTP